MSGFDRALGALSRREMLECARGLLKYLTGTAGAEAPDAASVSRAEAGRGAGGSGAAAVSGTPRPEPGSPEAAAKAARGEYGAGAEPARRGEYAPESPPSPAEAGGGAASLPERRRQSGEHGFAVSGAGRVRAGETESGGADAAVFQGPERRYENAVGARGSEMSRVSDYFRRDSRRYDAGFTRF